MNLVQEITCVEDIQDLIESQRILAVLYTEKVSYYRSPLPCPGQSSLHPQEYPLEDKHRQCAQWSKKCLRFSAGRLVTICVSFICFT